MGPPEVHGNDATTEPEADRLLLTRYGPPAAVIDDEFCVLSFRGRRTTFLKRAAGESPNLLRMTRGAVAQDIKALVGRARSEGAAVQGDWIQVVQDNRLRLIRISVHSLEAAEPARFMVIFDEYPSLTEKMAAGRTAGKPVPAVRQLVETEQELAATRRYLHWVIEEQESATEQLRTANEEIQSSNEELRSTNEELLSAKEELQSAYEELLTVNGEMLRRNIDLDLLNNDLTSLLSSVNIPIVMVGSDLRIRRFTPQAEKILNLRPTDIGRPVRDFAPKINIADLETLFANVIDHLQAWEREVQDLSGRHYMMWIRPYRTLDNKIDGAVLALFDITKFRLPAEICASSLS